VSLFCGAGFADLALMRAAEAEGLRVEIVDAIDSWGRAVNVYNRNHERPARVANIKNVAHTDLPAHDLVIGGPPCQPFSSAGKRGGAADERDCIPDFLHLAATAPWVMENVKPRLVSAPWSAQLCAYDFGDATSRKRWFYSTHLLFVIGTQPRRTLRDIRDPDADAAALGKRGPQVCQSRPTSDDEPLGTLTAGKGGVSGFLAVGMRSYPQPCRVIADDAPLGSFTAHTHDQPLRVGMKSAGGSSRDLLEDEPLLGLTAVTHHWQGRAALGAGARCPSLLEMQRAHSIPDTWDWGGYGATDRGKMIANGWPVEMGTAVLRAMLRAL
jgi:site-specific DNA-cytosine methylase